MVTGDLHAGHRAQALDPVGEAPVLPVSVFSAGPPSSSTGSPATVRTFLDYAVPFVQTVINAIICFPAEDITKIQAWTDDFVLL